MKDIIKILQQNARISNTALGEMLGISAEEAAAEIEKLEKSGVIKEILVENGEPVEFGQPLFILE